MSDSSLPPHPGQPIGGSTPTGAVVPGPSYPTYGMPAPVAGYGQPMRGPVGQERSTGMAILLYIVTLGIYGLYWYFVVHDEMKRRRGIGLGGLVALLLAIFVGFLMPFFTSDEVGKLYSERGQHPPVTAITGLWILLPFVGWLIWFVKTNSALNEYWRAAAHGA